MKEKLRITCCEIEQSLFRTLMGMLVGRGRIINNPDIIRCDDKKTGDVVFYEKKEKSVIP